MGWALDGYRLESGLGDCPMTGYGPYDNTVPSGTEDTTICVKNTYDACAATDTTVEGPSATCLQTFAYRVRQLGNVGLSYWALKLPPCGPSLTSTVVSVDYGNAGTWQTITECRGTGPDDSLCYRLGEDALCDNLHGVHVEIPEGLEVRDGDLITFAVTLDHQYELGPAEWRSKAGTCGCDGAGQLVTGPSCEPCCTPPVADFTVDTISGCAPIGIQFTDQSSEDTISWTWGFGDGFSSTVQSPNHVYAGRAGTLSPSPLPTAVTRTWKPRPTCSPSRTPRST